MTVKLSMLVAALSLVSWTAAHSQTPAPAPKRDLGAEAVGGTASSRSVITPEQRKKMLEEQAAGKQPPAPAAPAKVTAVQPGLLEVTGGRVNDAVAAGIQKITAKGAEGNRSIQIYSPWGHMYSGWPKGVKPVAFTIETTKGGSAKINAPGFKEANKDDYKSAVDAVVTMAIEKASAQKAAKSSKM
ncbi:MAG TPA: hypothetical protein VL654_02645 [Casimicrobiaceae bacterium]|jgi:hypothetical protein|nr:hypothetical protein [Casimicrobiaceae bacterium]